MPQNFTPPLYIYGLAALLTIVTGCSERIQRENVFANTETGIGIFIAQDPKTQMYEGKVGYFRHELFYVPTGKLVIYKPKEAGEDEYVEDGELSKNEANIVPDVLAEIQVGIKPGSNAGIGMDLYQRLAVGPNAVQSTAAVVMLNNESQTNLSELIDPPVGTKKLRVELDKMVESGTLKGDAATNFADVEAFADKLAEKITGGKSDYIQVRADGGANLKLLMKQMRKSVTLPVTP